MKPYIIWNLNGRLSGLVSARNVKEACKLLGTTESNYRNFGGRIATGADAALAEANPGVAYKRKIGTDEPWEAQAPREFPPESDAPGKPASSGTRAASTGREPTPAGREPTPAAARAAAATLESLGYTYTEGAARWRPPLGTPPDLAEIDRRRALAEVIETGSVLRLEPEDRARVCAALREGWPRIGNALSEPFPPSTVRQP